MGDIRWTHKGTELRTFSDLRDVITVNDGLNITSTLTLYEVYAEDNGMYYCEAFGTPLYVDGFDSQNATLTVRQAPEVISIPLPLFLIEGESSEANCVFEGYPEPTVKWVNKTNVVVSPKSQWVMDNVSIELEGVYRCVGSNSQGTTYSDWVSVTVYSVPRITSVFQEQMEMNAGVKLELECNNTGKIILEYIWIFVYYQQCLCCLSQVGQIQLFPGTKTIFRSQLALS